MHDHKSVIIAGAGTSVEFGLRSGEAIFAQFQTYGPDSGRHDSGYDYVMKDFYSFIEYYARDLQTEAKLCIDHMRLSGSGSIDLFAHQRKEYVQVAKLMSTWSLFGRLHEAAGKCRRFNFAVTQIFNGAELQDVLCRNWLAHVFQAYAKSAQSTADLSRDSLTFITFNYDRLIETGLASFLRNAFEDFSDQALPRVIHVHGVFDPLKEDLSGADVAAQASKIRYVLQESDRVAEKELKIAKAALKEADVIFCAGFAFDDLNWSLLDLDEHADKLRVLNYDNHPRINATLSRMGVDSTQVWHGEAEKPLGVGLAAQRGFFDQLPPPRSVYETRGLISM